MKSTTRGVFFLWTGALFAYRGGADYTFGLIYSPLLGGPWVLTLHVGRFQVGYLSDKTRMPSTV